MNTKEIAKSVVDEIERRENEKECFLNLCVRKHTDARDILRKEYGFFKYYFVMNSNEITLKAIELAEIEDNVFHAKVAVEEKE